MGIKYAMPWQMKPFIQLNNERIMQNVIVL